MSAADQFLEALAERHGRPNYVGATFIEVEGDHLYLEIAKGLKDTAWISMINLPPHLRGQGHGSRIMREIIDLATEHGCSIGLEAFWSPLHADGGRTVRFYSHLGFRCIGINDEEYMEMIVEPHPSSDLICEN